MSLDVPDNPGSSGEGPPSPSTWTDLLVIACRADGVIDEIIVDGVGIDVSATMFAELLEDEAIGSGLAFVREVADDRSMAPWTGPVIDHAGGTHPLTFVGMLRNGMVLLVGTGMRPGDGSSASTEALIELSRANNQLMDLHRQVTTANARLERAQQARDRLLAIVAHDLRSPVGIVHGLVQTTIERYGSTLDSQAVTLLDRAMVTSQRMLALVDDLLTGASVLSEGVTVNLVDLDLRDLVEEIASRYREAADAKSIALHIDMPSDPLMATVDAGRMLQVLDNLVSNAVKYSPVDASATISIAASRAEDLVTIAVADQGPGISQDELATLWEPFIRGSATPTAGERSTGLGLAIAHAIVSAHHGSLHVTTALGEGSTFSVILGDNCGGLPLPSRINQSET